jgi:hypothetical protein
MKIENYHEGTLPLDSYSNARNILKEEAKKINSKLESSGYLEFTLKEIKSCTSLVYRTFGNPEIVFSLSKQKPPMENIKFTHIEFRNRLSLDLSRNNNYLKEIKKLFEISNKSLLEKYSFQNF